jgi:adenylate cyclase, class 2
MNARRGTRRPLETEIKLPVHNPHEVKRRLRELGFRTAKARHFERNLLFDFPDLRLRKARCLVRLRYLDGEGLLTFKGAPLHSRDYKVRREVETRVEDAAQLREIFESLGLRQAFTYEKYRTIYAQREAREEFGPFQVCYDETPIGDYLELEGAERRIDEVARQLGHSRQDYITASYAVLYRQSCRAQGKEPGNMVFRTRKS